MAAITDLNSPLADCRSLPDDNPSGGVTAGTIINNGNLWGFAFADSPDNASVPSSGVTVNRLSQLDTYCYIYFAPRVTVVKATVYAVAKGAICYWDPVTDDCTDRISTGRVAIGYWLDSYAAATASGQIEFDGTLESKL